MKINRQMTQEIFRTTAFLVLLPKSHGRAAISWSSDLTTTNNLSMMSLLRFSSSEVRNCLRPSV